MTKKIEVGKAKAAERKVKVRVTHEVELSETDFVECLLNWDIDLYDPCNEKPLTEDMIAKALSAYEPPDRVAQILQEVVLEFCIAKIVDAEVEIVGGSAPTKKAPVKKKAPAKKAPPRKR